MITKYISAFRLKKYKTNVPIVKISRAQDIVNYCKEHLYKDDLEIYESLFALYLNKANNITNIFGFAKISQGGISGTVYDIVLVAKYAIDSLCSSVILCHNHPSGNCKPSTRDLTITSETKEALSLFKIVLLDHIILTKDSYLSLSDEHLI